jgi:hypothetical protein
VPAVATSSFDETDQSQADTTKVIDSRTKHKENTNAFSGTQQLTETFKDRKRRIGMSSKAYHTALDPSAPTSLLESTRVSHS